MFVLKWTAALVNRKGWIVGLAWLASIAIGVGLGELGHLLVDLVWRQASYPAIWFGVITIFVAFGMYFTLMVESLHLNRHGLTPQ